MAYRVIEHMQTGPNTRHLKVLVNPTEADAYAKALAKYTTAKAEHDADPKAKAAPVEPSNPSIHEAFDWGLDVPLEQALAETKLLLDAKYGKPVDLGELGEL